MYHPMPSACAMTDPAKTSTPEVTKMIAFWPLDAVAASSCFTMER